MRHAESHRSHRIGWLRAAVLGADDGIVSTASLIVGVAAADTPRLLGSLAARAGGSPVLKSAARVTFWGALAMGLTAGVGALFGARL